eukprot:COSAG02_NODE_47245_length_342_cov_1.267490_1_plen_40_part_01
MICVHAAAFDPNLVKAATRRARMVDLRVDVIESEARAAQL